MIIPIKNNTLGLHNDSIQSFIHLVVYFGKGTGIVRPSQYLTLGILARPHSPKVGIGTAISV